MPQSAFYCNVRKSTQQTLFHISSNMWYIFKKAVFELGGKNDIRFHYSLGQVLIKIKSKVCLFY